MLFLNHFFNTPGASFESEGRRANGRSTGDAQRTKTRSSEMRKDEKLIPSTLSYSYPRPTLIYLATPNLFIANPSIYVSYVNNLKYKVTTILLHNDRPFQHLFLFYGGTSRRPFSSLALLIFLGIHDLVLSLNHNQSTSVEARLHTSLHVGHHVVCWPYMAYTPSKISMTREWLYPLPGSFYGLIICISGDL
ncbi:uncharacterized protein BYT42DRAFT_271919 [Radiomyces spectabilis]|uniref:uncharacterized protein n=1 Tax=Radiomyces spectabilis TaxID=64574 RepID=UPI002220E4CA|nr:uncharacterized protein BYT42DRAFT_271919 [Radiomyces spectabilis]KAI8384713.1 hypothetical protein BYT42DRAFT_271919 [Radiomyces spectabilis]